MSHSYFKWPDSENTCDISESGSDDCFVFSDFFLAFCHVL